MVRRYCFCIGVCSAVAAVVLITIDSRSYGDPVLAQAGAVGDSTAARRFTLVYNVNNAGYIDVCGCKHKEVRQGSLTRRASFLKQLRATGRDLLLLDGGSSLFSIRDPLKKHTMKEAIRKAELIVEAYNRMGYGAMAIGPYDLAAGLDTLKEMEKRAKFEFLSANLIDEASGKLLFKPHTVFEVAGVKVGVVGLTLETMGRAFLQKNAPTAKLTDPLAALKTSLQALDSVDVNVVLAHLKEKTNRKIAETFPDVHLLVDPYIQYDSHRTWIKEDEWLHYWRKTVMLRSDGQGARMGVLDIDVYNSGKNLVSVTDVAYLQQVVAEGTATEKEKKQLEDAQDTNRFYFQRISLEPHHLTDPEIDHLVKEWKNNTDPTQIDVAAAPLPDKKDYLTAEKCRSCHEDIYKFWKGTAHGRALDSLKKTGDEHRFDCVGCHTLGYGKAFLNTAEVGPYAHVQCESCHGTNPDHAKDPQAHKYRRVSRKDCIVCHNKEQTKTDFRYGIERRQVACTNAQ